MRIISGTDRKKGITVITVVIVATVLFIMLHSAFYIAEHFDHECTGEDCPICSCLYQCEMILRGLESGLLTEAGVFALILFVKEIIPIVSLFFPSRTPVSGKVRLNN